MRTGECNDSTAGVNLNRNYGHLWGNDDEGSSGEECESDFRGHSMFSELETVAIKKLIQDNNFSIAISFETAGKYYF